MQKSLGHPLDGRARRSTVAAVMSIISPACIFDDWADFVAQLLAQRRRVVAVNTATRLFVPERDRAGCHSKMQVLRGLQAYLCRR